MSKGNDMMNGMMGAMLLAMGIGTLIIVVLVIIVIIVLLRTLDVSKRTTSDAPLQILQERFARGEISQADYQERRAILQQRL